MLYLQIILLFSFLYLLLFFFIDCNPVTLSLVLSFFSGSEVIPPQGFPNKPTLNFNADDPFPTASTCAIELTLPTKYSDGYSNFKRMMNIAFTCHGGFGKT